MKPVFLLVRSSRLAPFEVAPVGQLLVGDVELLGDVRFVHQHVAQHAALAVVVLGEVAGEDMAALHHARRLELRYLLAHAEAGRVLVGVGQDIEFGHLVRVDGWERLGHDAAAHALGKVGIAGILLAEDVDALAALREAVLGGVDHAPLDRVAEVGEAAQDDGEVAPALGRGGLEQAVDVLEKAEAGILHLEEVVDIPPQDALLALDAVGLVEGRATE